MNAAAKANATTNNIGFDVGIKLVSAEVGGKVSMPFTETKLKLGVEGKLGALGLEANIDIKNRTINFGCAAIAGFGFSIGLE